jgi:Flp pilus assembly pilin Flp
LDLCAPDDLTSHRTGRKPEQEKQMRQLIHDESGQATAEYALVVVAAAAIAGALIVWASSTGALGDLFNAVINRVSSLV